ncbi:MAG: tetratricopeptide repeat protein [Betaproteobacteria bacterium]
MNSIGKCARYAAVLLCAAAILWSASSCAGMEEGIAALRKGDYATAAKELRPLAERGVAEAQYRVGLMYEFGKGFAVDKPVGVSWLRKAAQQGHVGAQVELGVIYATGDGVPKEDVQAAGWFQKAATQGDSIAQYNLGLFYAKGQGVKRDDAQAIAWFRKSADQGYVGAQFKLGVAYENGEGVAKDPILAYADYAIAARDGNQDYVAHRDAAARALNPAQLGEAQTLASGWKPGDPMPVRSGTGNDATAAKVARAPDKCSATGAMEGEKFVATHCAVSLYGDQNSVAIWFSEDAIAPEEAADFQFSSHAADSKGGKRRTLVQIMFCPGGGAATASAASVKSMDFNTNHAKSPLVGVQRVVEAPKDFKVERLAGEIKQGGVLAGKIVGSRGKTSWSLDFDVNLPTKDAAAGLSCGK